MIKKLWPNILIALVSVLLTYVMADIGYRIYRRYKITTEYQEYYFQGIDQPIYALDEQIGFRYKPNLQGFYANFDKTNSVLQSNHFKINNMGHISPTDDTVFKPASEFRIGIIGDSFTASIHNDTPWPSLLEQRLNEDQNLKTKLGVSSFKVINFGMDGTGIVQWPSVVSYEVLRYNPDLLIVNFITDDITRRFVWRISVKPPQSNGDYFMGLLCSSLPANLGNRDCAVAKMITFNASLFDDKKELSRVKREIYDEESARIDWVSFYPELLARTLGRSLGLRPRLSLSDLQIPSFSTKDEGIKASTEALQQIKTLIPNTIILHNPVYSELRPISTPPEVIKIMQTRVESMQRDPSLGIVLMENHMPDTSDDAEVLRWFKLPWDPHFSDYGAKIYAQAVYGQLQEHLPSSATFHGN
jgi:hypothetical protein